MQLTSRLFYELYTEFNQKQAEQESTTNQQEDFEVDFDINLDLNEEKEIWK